MRIRCTGALYVSPTVVISISVLVVTCVSLRAVHSCCTIPAEPHSLNSKQRTGDVLVLTRDEQRGGARPCEQFRYRLPTKL